MKKKNILLSLGVGVLAISTAFALGFIKQNQNNIVIEASAEEDYYAGCEGLEGNQLLSKLNTIVNKNKSVSYDWSRYEAADEDPYNSSNIVTVYARSSLAKTDHVHSGNVGWNREHTYPQSKISGDALSDNHLIFASDAKINGKRGNNRLGQVTSGDYLTDSYGNLTTCRLTGGIFDPGDTIARGLVARSTMYAAVAYGLDIDNNITSYAKCLEWHFAYYPTDIWDVRRNNTVYSKQKNRNPFVDHPEYAAYIWGHHDADCEAICEKYMTTLEDLTVTGTPTKTSYKMGESFNPTGLTVTASFSNGTSKDVTENVVWSPKPLTAGTTSVTGTYSYGDVSKQVVVNGITVATATSITYTGTPTKKIYFEGDKFLSTGCSFFLKFSDDSTLPLDASQITWGALVAGATSVTGTYGDLSVTVTGLTVKAIVVNELELSGNLAKTVYNEGETFDPTGLIVYALYNNNKREDVTSQVVWSPTSLTAETTKVTGTFKEKTVTVNVTVNKVVPKSSGGGCSASITSNSSIVFIGGIALLAIAIRMAVKYRKEQ